MDPIDHDALVQIAAHIVPGGLLVAAQPLAGGVSANVVALDIMDPDAPEDRPERVVLRQHGATDWKELEQDVTTTEFHLLDRLHRAGLPVPRPRLLDDSARVLSSPFMVMDFVEGTTVSPDQARPEILQQMATFLADLHALDPATLDLPALPPRVDPVPSILEHMTAELEPLRALLAGRSPRTTMPTALLHGDYWQGNILWADGRIAAVLDWEDAALGDPLSDLAGSRIELLWRQGEEVMEAYTQHYQRRHAVDFTELAVWELHVATGADAFMEHWGLPPQVEATMRARTASFIRRAAQQLTGA